ncbi:MAG: hypothetical protein ABIQ95_13775, partial [Bdellovibrionia bacterium]
EAPTTLFGSPPNYYEQRVRSWEMGRHIYFWKFVKNIVMPGPPRSVGGHVFVKGVQALAVVGNVVDYIRVPILAVMATDPSYWIKMGAFTGASVVPTILWNYVKISDRPDLQSTFRAVATIGVYKQLYSVVSVLSIFRALFIHLPNVQHKPTISELENFNDPRCVWLQWGQPLPEPSTEPSGEVEPERISEVSEEPGNS